jgi:hypothetical protein
MDFLRKPMVFHIYVGFPREKTMELTSHRLPSEKTNMAGCDITHKLAFKWQKSINIYK